MYERMSGDIKIDPTTLQVDVNPEPIKTAGVERQPLENLQGQADIVRNNVVKVDYFATRGTCIDERPRIGLLAGENKIEVRPSVPGGPDVYGLAIKELSGMFDDEASAEERLHQTKDELNKAGIQSGGHLKCKANGGFGEWMRILVENPDIVFGYARLNLGARFDESAAHEVMGYAQAVVKSGRYDHWNEDILADEFGNEAGGAIEKLADVEHEASTIVRQKHNSATIDQNTVYEQSVLGKGTYVMDDEYAALIEHYVTLKADDAAWKQTLAEHAREFILAALAGAVPNEELYQIVVQ